MFTMYKFPPRRNYPSPGNVIRSSRTALKLPNWMRRLDVRCHGRSHAFMQARMGFIAWGRTPQGDPIARYGCPLCGLSEAWGLDHHTGQPRRIHRASPKT